MNSQLIEKVIKTNNLTCPDIAFTNPLLDRNLAKALSKSFVEMLTTSRQCSNVNSNLRHTVLNNVRKICKNAPENHLQVKEEFTNLLTECYIENIQEESNSMNTMDKQLDDFLIRRISQLNYRTQHISSDNPEIFQALINLNPSQVETLSNNIINWNVDNRNLNILSKLWTTDLLNEDICDDISIQIKSKIERNMLDIMHFLLTTTEADLSKIFNNNNLLKQLIMKCSTSSKCFQICCAVANYLFITTTFNPRIENFIPIFVKNVKQNCTKTTFVVLYPTHLSHIVLLLDFDVNTLSESSKFKCVNMVLNYFHNLHEKSENDLIMLLSHFPQWFDIYFENRDIT